MYKIALLFCLIVAAYAAPVQENAMTIWRELRQEEHEFHRLVQRSHDAQMTESHRQELLKEIHSLLQKVKESEKDVSQRMPHAHGNEKHALEREHHALKNLEQHLTQLAGHVTSQRHHQRGEHEHHHVEGGFRGMMSEMMKTLGHEIHVLEQDIENHKINKAEADRKKLITDIESAVHKMKGMERHVADEIKKNSSDAIHRWFLESALGEIKLHEKQLLVLEHRLKDLHLNNHN